MTSPLAPATSCPAMTSEGVPWGLGPLSLCPPVIVWLATLVVDWYDLDRAGGPDCSGPCCLDPMGGG